MNGLLSADLVLAPLKATSKKQVFQTIATEVARIFHGDEDALFADLLARERIGTTGIGHGVAIPHIHADNIDRMYQVLAVLDKPVDFDAVDQAPVDIVFTLIAPATSKTTQHLKTLSAMSRFLRNDNVRAALRDTARQQHPAPDFSVIQDIWLKQA